MMLAQNLGSRAPMLQAGAARVPFVSMQYSKYQEDGEEVKVGFTSSEYSSRLSEDIGNRGESIGGWDGATGGTKNTVNDLIGAYSLTGIVYDPLNLAEKYDIDWMREAEIKHGRVTMLAIVGFLANDAGLKFPGEAFQGISSTDAHDAMVESGHMWGLLAFVGTSELFHASVIVPKLDTTWPEGWKHGDYNIDPFKIASPFTREAEIKHSRLAMLAFGGLVTQAGLGYAPFAS